MKLPTVFENSGGGRCVREYNREHGVVQSTLYESIALSK
jgi:hypothetical protein